MVTQTKPRPAATLEPWRFTVDQYYAMAKAGILKKEDRVELIDGVLVAMAPIGNRHLATTDRCTKIFIEAVGGRAIVRVQGSVTFDDRTMPEPDLTLLKPRDDFYASEAAGPGDVLLIVEVSDSSLEYDRGEKLALYARFGILETWIAALPEQTSKPIRNPRVTSISVNASIRPATPSAPAAFLTLPCRSAKSCRVSRRRTWASPFRQTA